MQVPVSKSQIERGLGFRLAAEFRLVELEKKTDIACCEYAVGEGGEMGCFVVK